jgi:hypothetical protein
LEEHVTIFKAEKYDKQESSVKQVASNTAFEL